MLFERFITFKSIQRAVYEQGYTNPTPIQEQSIPLAGKDLMVVHKLERENCGICFNYTPIHRIVGSSKKAKANSCIKLLYKRTGCPNWTKFVPCILNTIDHFWVFHKPQVDAPKSGLIF
jgi:hypothetical protein